MLFLDNRSKQIYKSDKGENNKKKDNNHNGISSYKAKANIVKSFFLNHIQIF